MRKAEFEKGNYWGLSLHIDLKDCDIELITSKPYIRKYIELLCKFIDMKPFGRPKIVYFGEEDRVKGYSATQLIETSLLSAHFSDSLRTAYIDIFSCKWFDVDKAINFTSAFFKGEINNVNILKRN